MRATSYHILSHSQSFPIPSLPLRHTNELMNTPKRGMACNSARSRKIRNRVATFASSLFKPVIKSAGTWFVSPLLFAALSFPIHVFPADESRGKQNAARNSFATSYGSPHAKKPKVCPQRCRKVSRENAETCITLSENIRTAVHRAMRERYASGFPALHIRNDDA